MLCRYCELCLFKVGLSSTPFRFIFLTAQMVKRPKADNTDSSDSEIFEAEAEDTDNLRAQLEEIDSAIAAERERFFDEQAASQISTVPDDCIPICADVRGFNFEELARVHYEVKGKLFDVIMMDPPWQLSGANPTRGVTISYSALPDAQVMSLPIAKLQETGLIFIWTINAKYRFTLKLLDKWGYRYVDELVWVKKTSNKKIAKSHGYWLQHAKESCLVGVKGDFDAAQVDCSDVIFSLRRGQSQKPLEIYERIETLVPGGSYLEIFGRRNNLRAGWVTIGNEL
mmetsp:Transcript_28643/g.50939  ORF Transcript_28643/g.50939 Transcript_28643/m.50939 type:complete len:284 (+) Transcript_28643:1500-2351(+)